MEEIEGQFKGRNEVLEFMRQNRDKWLSSDGIFTVLKPFITKRKLILWLKRWEKMGILRMAKVSELRDEGIEVNQDVHFSSYMWIWHEGAEDIGK